MKYQKDHDHDGPECVLPTHCGNCGDFLDHEDRAFGECSSCQEI